MDEKKFVNKIREIEMPKDMQQRMIENCYIETEKKNMSKMFKRPMVAVASLALCICVTGVTALAATGKLEGYFKDIKRWDGAVVGTSYEQATKEVEVSIINVTDQLIVEITMLDPNVAPYSETDMLGIEEYKITDANGNTIVENEELKTAIVESDSVIVTVPVKNLSEGEYTLVVSKLVSEKKADQPLSLSGTWECDFVIQK